METEKTEMEDQEEEFEEGEVTEETPTNKTGKAKYTEEQIKQAIEGPIPLNDHEIRMVRQDPYVWRNFTGIHNRVTRGRAIRLKCLDCCCGQIQEVRLCRTITCALWPYRMGGESRDFPRWPNESEEEYRKACGEDKEEK